MQVKGRQWLILAGSLSIVVALLHIRIIFGGAPAYRYFGAGEEIAKLAESGSILPTLLTLFLAAVFVIWGLYAFSGVGLIRRLPLLHTGLAVIAGIYTLRGIGIVPQLFWIAQSPQSVPFQEMIFSVGSLFIGIVYFIGITRCGILKADQQMSESQV